MMSDFMTMNIAVALNSKYFKYTYVMLTSLFTNNSEAEVHVYVLHSDLKQTEEQSFINLASEHNNVIHFLKINRDVFPNTLPTTETWSFEVYFRLLLLDLLPQDIDRILYLDVDMIINKPIYELYMADFDGALFCACKDMPTTYPFPDMRNELFHNHIKQGFTYFNSGCMLWNIRKMRGKYDFSKYMALAERLDFKLFAPDQDLLNYMHVNQINFLDENKYNLFAYLAYNNGMRYDDVKLNTSIIHYAGNKPWEGEYVHYDIEQLWWDYAKETPFYYDLMEQFLFHCLNKDTIYNALFNLSNEKNALKQELDKSVVLCQKLLQIIDPVKN